MGINMEYNSAGDIAYVQAVPGRQIPQATYTVSYNQPGYAPPVYGAQSGMQPGMVPGYAPQQVITQPMVVGQPQIVVVDRTDPLLGAEAHAREMEARRIAMENEKARQAAAADDSCCCLCCTTLLCCCMASAASDAVADD
eukprot:TRINITY_DN3071_c0_g1_i6.p1 TRINITY_DN3071_c0_g1~~TRINITY_DN3071_c0_g1_i6.p1  ORF type:complete len:140 (+),score=18.14 TRINITY_DN3071_c0_g1_i6:112-531(+)